MRGNQTRNYYIIFHEVTYCNQRFTGMKGKSFRVAARYIEIDTKTQKTVLRQRDAVSLKPQVSSGKQDERT